MDSKLPWVWEISIWFWSVLWVYLHCFSKKSTRFFPLQKSDFPMIHFELNHGWQFYYKYVAVVIVIPKEVIEKICKVIKLDFSSVENEEINVRFKNNILRDVYIKTKRFKFDLLFTLGIALSDLEEKKDCLKLFHFT